MSGSTADKPLKFANDTLVYRDLLDAWKSRVRPVVIWAGAGLSKPADLPDWSSLQKSLIDEADKYVNSLSTDQKKEKQNFLQSIKSIENQWVVFEKLESILGKSNFEASIRRNLNPALKCKVPKLYLDLWKLGINGLITLNIDRLASRAYSEAQIRNSLIERNGFDCKALINAISSANNERFIANLHGAFEDPSTWVFTESKRKALFSDERYKEFVRDTLKYCTVVFLGVTASDIAITEHMDRIIQDGLGTNCFWITNEVGSIQLRRSENSGIRFISYKNDDGNHEQLNYFLEDIRAFTPLAEDAPPVQLQSISPGDHKKIPDPNQLLTLIPNEQREILNQEATKILNENTEKAYGEFDSFCSKYSRAIHAANYIDLGDESNKIMDFKVISIADQDGGFGTIWRATNDSGEQFAIKVFKHDIRKNQSLLKAFRRGVRSLQLLSKHNLPNIVKFITASEIPPVLVMEWIEGVNLFDAISQGYFRDWHSKLRVAAELSKSIYQAHSVPERVLHRDIKPQNIMFRDFYSDPDNSELVVLDFDLSWHIGALEKSVLAKGANPYLAPEQLTSINDMTSRSAAVDAYGLGMTLFFLFTGNVPAPFMHQSNEWKFKLQQIEKTKCNEWRSIPKRIARLIKNCTEHNQNNRPSFSQITAELSKLQNVIQGDIHQVDIRFICEDLAARIDTLEGYEVEDDGKVTWNSRTGRLKVILNPEIGSTLSIKFEFIQTGNEKFNSLSHANEIISCANKHFNKKFLTRNSTLTIQHGHYIHEIHAELSSPWIADEINEIGSSIETVLNQLMRVSN